MLIILRKMSSSTKRLKNFLDFKSHFPHNKFFSHATFEKTLQKTKTIDIYS